MQAAQLIQQFQDVTAGAIQKNENSGVIKFLRSTVKTLESITKKIDKFLKSKNIDAAERIKQLSDKTTDVYGKAKGVVDSTKASIKQIGIKNFIKTKTAGVQASIASRFTNDTEAQAGPPQESESRLDKFKGTIENLATSVTELSKKIVPANFGGKSSQEQLLEGISSSKTTSSEEYAQTIQKSKERAEKRAKEIEQEKQSVKDREAKNTKKGGSWLGKILGGIGKLGSFMVGGFGKIIVAAVPALVKMTGKMMGGILTRMVPGLAGGIAKGVSSLLGTAAKTAGGTAWNLAKMAVTRGAPALLAGAKTLGVAAAGAIGTTGMIIAGGVVAAGLLIYGGYKLYKYLNRNNVATDIFGQLTRLRLLMYGFNDSKKESYHKLMELEMMMKDYVQVKDGKVFFVKLDQKLKNNVKDLFEVKDDEKEKYAILNTWFSRRFIPAFKTFMQAFMVLGPNLYLDTLDKLSKDQVFQLASTLIPPTSIYDVTQIPTFDDPKTPVVKQEVDDMLASIRTKAKEATKQMSGPSPQKTRQELQKATSTQAVAAAATGTAITNAGKPPVVTPPSPTASMTPPTSQLAPTPSLPLSKVETPGQEGEGPAPTGSGQPSLKLPNPPSEATKLNVAPGGLQPGDKSLQGIRIGPKGDRDKMFQMHPKVFSLFTGMAKEYNTLTGKEIPVNESARSYQDQLQLYQKYPNKAAKPGNSIHEFGMALDINSEQANELDQMGLMRKYGFTRPVGGETWHIEPAGVAVNPQGAKSDPVQREQAIASSPGRGGGGYGASKGTPLGKRNMALQAKLFEDDANAKPVDVTQIAQKLNEGPQFTGPARVPEAPASKLSARYGGGASSQGPSATGGYTNSIAPNPTRDSMDRSGIDTSSEYSLQTNSASSTSNMDPGAIGTKNLSPAQAIRKAANVVGMNPESMVTFAKLESSLDPKAGASTSSAKGLFQITQPTWNGLLPKQGPQYNVPRDADIFDPYYNSVIGISYAKENAKTAIPLGQQAGLPEEVSLYLAHHFGPSGSKRLIQAYMSNPNQSTQEAVSSSTFNANKAALQGKTVGQYIQSLFSKMEVAAKTPETAYKGMKGYNQGKGTASTDDSATSAYSGAQSYPVPPRTAAPTRLERTDSPAAFPTTSYPVRQASAKPVSLPPQPSATQTLDPNTEILNNQLGVLTDIRKILESIGGQLARPAPSTQPAPQALPAPVEPPAEPTPAPAPSGQRYASMNRAPSTSSVSMSRRPVV